MFSLCATRKAPPKVLGSGRCVRTFVWVLVGVLLFAAVVASVFASGCYRVHGLGSVAGAVGLVGLMAAVAVTEEVMYRGVLFRIVEQWTGTWIALVLTGALFGAAHLLNPDGSVWGAAAIAVEAGGMLTAAYIAARVVLLWSARRRGRLVPRRRADRVGAAPVLSR